MLKDFVAIIIFSNQNGGWECIPAARFHYTTKQAALLRPVCMELMKRNIICATALFGSERVLRNAYVSNMIFVNYNPVYGVH